ncbi:MAG: ammonium transporter [Caldilineaceae bacterium]|nr:ammonium transporter [Caldilineaceae bacterium]MCB9136794.1 ammonium transporter [Caldilineaceae bacterium]
MRSKILRALPLALLLSLVAATAAFAQEGDITVNEVAYALDNIVLLISAVLVLFMQAGFAMVETGFNSAKNAVNIMFKNIIDLGAGVVIYWLIGFSIMYGANIIIPGWLAFSGFGISSVPPEALPGNLNPQVDFLFQAAFAATAATIVSGAVAGRMKVSGYLIYSVAITAIIYPISGYWKWGGGWLDAMGFYDFAGSILVHAVGGFAALAAVIVLGPRIGRFSKDGKNPFPPHSMGLATLGVFILFVGWFGFNPGSQLAFAGAANTNATMLIATNTALAAAAGTLLAMAYSWIRHGKPDLGYTLNGMLAGLVGITANCDSVTNVEALIIGAVAGVLVGIGIDLLEAWKIDDTVGAWPVHGLVGIWGGLATGIFGGHPLVAQIVGSIVVPAWAFGTSFVLFSILKAAGLLRVSPEEEQAGLDLSEHGMGAYDLPGFGAAAGDD